MNADCQFRSSMGTFSAFTGTTSPRERDSWAHDGLARSNKKLIIHIEGHSDPDAFRQHIINAVVHKYLWRSESMGIDQLVKGQTIKMLSCAGHRTNNYLTNLSSYPAYTENRGSEYLPLDIAFLQILYSDRIKKTMIAKTVARRIATFVSERLLD